MTDKPLCWVIIDRDTGEWGVALRIASRSALAVSARGDDCQSGGVPMSAERIDVEALRWHTPLPWTGQDIVGTTDKGNTYVLSATGELLASVLHACQSTPAEYASPDRILRARADARLIAAAPALLAEVIERRARDAAVAELVDAASALTVYRDGRGYFESGAACERFRAALKAIRGTQP